jgi:hypothetical protein
VRPEVLDDRIIRMIGDDPGLKRIQRGTGWRLSYSHSLTGFRISREQGHHEPVDQLDEWIKEIHLFSTTSTVQPGRDIASYADMGGRPKVSSNPWTPLMSVECRNRESTSKLPMTVDRTRQEIWKQLDEMGLKMEATPLATDAITRVKEGVSMHTGLHVTGTNDTTQEENNVFVWKDVGGKIHRDNPRILDASMQPDTKQKQRHRFDIHRH